MGPVNPFVPPVRSNTQAHGGTYSAKLEGRSAMERMLEVTAGDYSVSAWAYRDANYNGDAPILELRGAHDGVLLASDAQAGAAGAWEQLSFTHTFAGGDRVAVRMVSRNDSFQGACWFDDLLIQEV
jgi:hypothetical protein